MSWNVFQVLLSTSGKHSSMCVVFFYCCLDMLFSYRVYVRYVDVSTTLITCMFLRVILKLLLRNSFLISFLIKAIQTNFIVHSLCVTKQCVWLQKIIKRNWILLCYTKLQRLIIPCCNVYLPTTYFDKHIFITTTKNKTCGLNVVVCFIVIR